MTTSPLDLGPHLARMRRVALRIVGDDDAAGDVVQDACARVLRPGGAGFDGRASETTWLHRVTVNCAIDHLRRERRAAGTDGSDGPVLYNTYAAL